MKDSPPELPRDESLESALRALPRELAPARDLWPGIAARIAPSRGSRRLATGLVASLLLAAVAAALVWQASRDTGAVPADAVLAADLRLPFEAARERYMADWADVRARLDPATAATIEGNLEVVQGALAEIDAALVEAPDDPRLRGLLRRTLESEIELYRRAARLAG
jgi:hypothetical protein